jgi:hypothetical protein
LKHNIQFREGSAGRFEVTVGPKQTMGKVVCIIYGNKFSYKLINDYFTA